ncbi:hypothetical protein GLOIN_2v1782301 [Rhizophagus irregularis DAOM 181602=DAOM 197198]|nr:hypothetical protein GLOIN_2v1782301 [Rhizophagus irregularis DAOM 181602=DAOM 197198]
MYSPCMVIQTECSSINNITKFRINFKYLHLKLYHIEEVFLKNSQNTFIKKLLICYYFNGQSILPSIKEYIMKKKRVKYLAIKKFNFAKTYD